MKIMLRCQLVVLLLSTLFSDCSAVDYRYFVAGGAAAAYSHGITTPIDVIKTKMQANPEDFNEGMLSAASKIVKKEGPGVLFAGLGPTVVGYGVEGAAKFGIYEILKPVFRKVIDDQSTAFLLASVAAGAVAALILCPAESVRIRIVTDPEYADKGLLTGMPKLIKERGFFEMFGGFPAMITKQVRSPCLVSCLALPYMIMQCPARLGGSMKWFIVHADTHPLTASLPLFTGSIHHGQASIIRHVCRVLLCSVQGVQEGHEIDRIHYVGCGCLCPCLHLFATGRYDFDGNVQEHHTGIVWKCH
jgi:hypothetical protein